MENIQTETPVVLIIYKRPSHTRRVFAEIARARPKQLFIVADGPKDTGEAALVTATRQVVSEVDWECDVQHIYADENMGLKSRIQSGLDVVFGQVERAIILEDDCVPCETFFPYCEALLDRYADDERVLHISGSNFVRPDRIPGQASYYASQYPEVFGWATWATAWQSAERSTELLEAKLLDRYQKRPVRLFWRDRLRRIQAGQLSSWAYLWVASLIINEGIGLIPRYNQVSNIGFGDLATHTQNREDPRANYPTHPLNFPLVHPEELHVHPAIEAAEVAARLTYVSPLRLWLRAQKRNLLRWFRRR